MGQAVLALAHRRILTLHAMTRNHTLHTPTSHETTHRHLTHHTGAPSLPRLTGGLAEHPQKTEGSGCHWAGGPNDPVLQV